MKKTLLMTAVAAGICLMAGTASAHDSTGCGLGSTLWKGKSGPGPQILAVTTNGTSGNQTFGITSGSSGCDPNGRITGGTGRMMLAFLQDNMEQFAMDASKGEGETITTLAGIMNVDSKKLGKEIQQNFAYIFPNDDVEVADVTLRVMEIAQA